MGATQPFAPAIENYHLYASTVCSLRSGVGGAHTLLVTPWELGIEQYKCFIIAALALFVFYWLAIRVQKKMAFPMVLNLKPRSVEGAGY